ncbi:MAG: DUF2206 domain-containing protein [Methanobacterium sp.]|nr:DUF2206 domain-containing protein [Methanobacterium sp.]
MLKINQMKVKDSLLAVIFLLFLTDICIIFNIPVLRPFTSFLFFTIIPGYLILLIFRLKQTDFLKKVVLSVGISISILMIVGMILNILYPIIYQPLALIPVLISLNILTLMLALLAYWRNRKSDKKNSSEYKFDLGDKLSSTLLFPFLFPLLAILGTYLMNISQNNILLLIMLILIPLYLIAVIYYRDRIHPVTYPLSVWLIGLSLLLMHGLTSYHLQGIDVHLEYYSFQLTQNTFHWDLNAYYNPYNACMSITILPMIYQVLSNLGGEYIFKLFMAFIGSITPLLVYLVARKYLASKYAFLTALLFIFQLFFINLLGAVRQEIAIIFFFLTVMVVFDSEMDKWARKFLIVLFIFSTLISHYSTAYVAFILLLPILLLPFLQKLKREKKLDFTNFDIIIVSLVLIAIWYFLVAKVQFASGVQVLGKTVEVAAGTGLTSALVATRGAYVLGILGVVFKSLPNAVSVIVHDLIFATILVGLYAILRNFTSYKEKFSIEFLLGIIISLILLVLFVALPYISIAYDVARLFFQLLIFLGPVFIIGGIFISKLIKRPKWDVYILLILLISLFACVTYLQYSILGTPYSPDFEKDSIVRQGNYIYDSEIQSAQWISQYKVNNLTVFSDGREVARFLTAYGTNITQENINSSYFGWNQTVDVGYIYLGYVNVNDQKIIDMGDDFIRVDLGPYYYLLTGKSTIYDNGGSRILWSG